MKIIRVEMDGGRDLVLALRLADPRPLPDLRLALRPCYRFTFDESWRQPDHVTLDRLFATEGAALYGRIVARGHADEILRSNAEWNEVHSC